MLETLLQPASLYAAVNDRYSCTLLSVDRAAQISSEIMHLYISTVCTPPSSNHAKRCAQSEKPASPMMLILWSSDA